MAVFFRQPFFFVGVFLLALGLAECYRQNRYGTNHHLHQQGPSPVLRMCDAIDESEECADADQPKIPTKPAKRPKFLLWKKDNVTGEGKYIRLSVDNATQIREEGQPIEGAIWKILIHGFLNNAYSKFPVNVRDAYMRRMERLKGQVKYNVLIVDWGELACPSVERGVTDYLYDYAAKNTAWVGKNLAEFLVFLDHEGIMDVTTECHILGFSLGSHVAGQAGRVIFKMLGEKPRRITGLDPAGPAFWAWRYLPAWVLPQRRLYRKDAHFLDVYHTSRAFGSWESMGHVDFWINGGTDQPSCVPSIFARLINKDFTQVCSHNYATVLYTKYLDDNSLYGCQCPSAISYHLGSCKCSERAVFGEMVDNSMITQGNFYVTTPRDDSDVSVLDNVTWRNFTIPGMIEGFNNMLCSDWIPGDELNQNSPKHLQAAYFPTGRSPIRY